MSTTLKETRTYQDERSVSADLHERALRVMPGGNTRTTVHLDPYPPYAVSGSGKSIIDAEGEERLDFLNNYTSLIHGHADPEVVEAVRKQLSKGTAFGLPTPYEVELAELLVERIPSVEQVRFTNSGTEAVMMALQAARAYTGRGMIAKFEGSYHGTYDFASVSTSVPPSDQDGEPPVVEYAEGTPESVLEQVIVLRYNDLDMLENVIAEHGNELAAVLIDVMPWRMGLVEADRDFLEKLREMTRKNGIVLIYDEVMTLRVAYGGMQELLGIHPDLTTMGKVIGGGFPVGAVGGSEDIMSVFDPRGGRPRVPHGGTFTGNPMTMTAGLAAMRKMTRERYDELNSLAAYLREGLAEAMDGLRIHGQVTGQGSFFGIHFHDDPIRDYQSWYHSAETRKKHGFVHARLLDHGILTAPAVTGCLSTPMDREDADKFIHAFTSVLRNVEEM